MLYYAAALWRHTFSADQVERRKTGITENYDFVVILRTEVALNINIRRRIRLGFRMPSGLWCFRRGKTVFMELTYKRATLRDLDALVEERVRAWKAENAARRKAEKGADGRDADDAGEDIFREHAYSYYRRNLTDNEDVVYLAYDGTDLAGLGNVYFVHKRPALRGQNKERAYISRLYVDPVYRKKGVAMKLVDLMVNSALENDAEEVTVDDSGSYSDTLEKYGFRQREDKWVYAL